MPQECWRCLSTRISCAKHPTREISRKNEGEISHTGITHEESHTIIDTPNPKKVALLSKVTPYVSKNASKKAGDAAIHRREQHNMRWGAKGAWDTIGVKSARGGKGINPLRVNTETPYCRAMSSSYWD